ncbi:hypothetical protein [Streptomyces sp. NPDC047928]|uniref:hypothetical protein n=1 Tax=unclassified Streptomyces TaxID=2593676 RepID=UPI0037227708
MTMLGESLAALAADLVTAVGQAAGTPAWDGLRTGVAGALGPAGVGPDAVELDLLRTDAALRAAGPAMADAERGRQEAWWRDRLSGLLAGLPEGERPAVAAEVRALLDERAAQGGGGNPGGVHITEIHHSAVQIGDGNAQWNQIGHRR